MRTTACASSIWCVWCIKLLKGKKSAKAFAHHQVVCDCHKRRFFPHSLWSLEFVLQIQQANFDSTSLCIFGQKPSRQQSVASVRVSILIDIFIVPSQVNVYVSSYVHNLVKCHKLSISIWNILHPNYDVQKWFWTVQARRVKNISCTSFVCDATQSYWSLPFEIKALRLTLSHLRPSQTLSDSASRSPQISAHINYQLQNMLKNMANVDPSAPSHICMALPIGTCRHGHSEPPNLGHFALNANVDVVNAVLVIGRQRGSHTLVILKRSRWSNTERWWFIALYHFIILLLIC